MFGWLKHDELPPLPKCDHDWRVSPQGWTDNPAMTVVADNGDLVNAGGIKHESRLMVCAKCDHGRYEYRQTSLAADWAKAID